MSKESEKQAEHISDPFLSAEQIIDRLPKRTWQERSFAFWADKQLHATSPLWLTFSSAAVGLTSTAMSVLYRLGFRKVVVEDLDKLTDIIEGKRDRPVITVANHISTMDDPMIWGVIPTRMRWNPDYMRWTLGAQELLYTNPFLNAFFAFGQTIPTVRGDGIYQLAVEIALHKLNTNKWVHVFPEGKVNQGKDLIRFKWGVGRMVMESKRTPIIIPIFHNGMQDVLPLEQERPIPRLNMFTRAFYLRVGNPIDLTKQVDEWRLARSKLTQPSEIARLDERTRIKIVDEIWDALNLMKSQSQNAIDELI